MKANELRIGNYLFVHGKVSMDQTFSQNSIWKITRVNATDIVAIDSHYSEWYKPIQITQKWLEKFEFEEVISGQWFSHKFQIFLRKDINGYLFEYSGGLGVVIAYVHELQNLYFSLTKEELI